MNRSANRVGGSTSTTGVFIGLQPPPGIRAGVSAMWTRHSSCPPELPEPAEDLHVTLWYLGDVQAGGLTRLTAALRAACAQEPPVNVEIGPATVLLTPTALVLPVSGADDLARTIRAAVTDRDLDPEQLPFSGHMTVARHRGDGVDAGPRLDQWEALPLHEAWTSREVRVFARLPNPRNHRYWTLARVPLRAGPPAG